MYCIIILKNSHHQIFVGVTQKDLSSFINFAPSIHTLSKFHYPIHKLYPTNLSLLVAFHFLPSSIFGALYGLSSTELTKKVFSATLSQAQVSRQLSDKIPAH